jgi:hypothetical protein
MVTVYLTREMSLEAIREKYSKTGVELHDRISNGANYMLNSHSVEALIVTEEMTLELPISSQRDFNRGEILYMELVEREEATDPKLLKILASALNAYEEDTTIHDTVKRLECSDEVKAVITKTVKKILKNHREIQIETAISLAIEGILATIDGIKYEENFPELAQKALKTKEELEGINLGVLGKATPLSPQVKIIEGMDIRTGKPLYQVVATDSEFVSEWFNSRKEAIREAIEEIEMLNIPMIISLTTADDSVKELVISMADTIFKRGYDTPLSAVISAINSMIETIEGIDYKKNFPVMKEESSMVLRELKKIKEEMI